MSAENEVRMIPRLPRMIIEEILKYISSTKDKSNCRLVCMSWLYIIDVVVGLGIKLTRNNKAKLFQSDLLRSCTSLKIYQSAGMSNWYVCYFSPKNLKSVEIVGNILSDNWKLLLNACKSLELLTIKLHVIKFNRRKHTASAGNEEFLFPADFVENKIDHYNLRRLVFKGIVNERSGEFTSIRNLMNTIGVSPRLRQIIFVLWTSYYVPDNLPFKNALLSLMQRNPGINSVGFVNERQSYKEMGIWDRLLQEDLSCLVYTCFNEAHWQSISARLLMLHTLYYEINYAAQVNEFQTLVGNIVTRSRNLKKLILAIFHKRDYDCRFLLQRLEHLTEMSICFTKYLEEAPTPATPTASLIHLNVLTNPNIKLKYFYTSIQLSEENLDAIFAIPLLEELHIRFQEPSEVFKRRHFDMIINHNRMKLIFWEKSFLQKWNVFNGECKQESWEIIKLKRANPISRHLYQDFHISHLLYVPVLDSAFRSEMEWKTKFADSFLVFNNQRVEETDLNRAIMENSYYQNCVTVC